MSVIGPSGVVGSAVIPEGAVDDHFGWIGRLVSQDGPASRVLTRQRLGWAPTHPSLMEDLDQGHHFDLSTRMGGGTTG